MALQQTLQPGVSASATPFAETLGGKAVLTVGASLFVAACAHMIVPVWFTPVPFTLGDLAVILVGLVPGPGARLQRAWRSTCWKARAGCRCSARPGPGGVAQLLFGATSGYLLAYPFAAALAGGLFRMLEKLPLGRRTRFRRGAGGRGCRQRAADDLRDGLAWATSCTCRRRWRWPKGATPFLPGQLVKSVLGRRHRHLR